MDDPRERELRSIETTLDLHPPRGRGDPSSSALRLTPGTILARRYRIAGFLGRGGMGEVYRADDLTLGVEVALKFLPAGLERDPVRLARVHDEVRAARRVSHPNVCRVHDVVELEGHRFLTMEYVDGETLDSLLRRIGRLPEDKAVEIAQQLCAALGAIHAEGLLHRDLKPGNVMLDGRGRARITDFGLAVPAEAADARLAGTPPDHAPEIFEGAPPSTASDLYALGLVLYEAFTGRRALDGATTFEEWRRLHLDSSPRAPSLPDRPLDPRVERALASCLAKAPGERPRSAARLASILPGGDPLAAALAAGETPSPELLAASSREGALSPGRAWAALLLVLAGIPLAIALGHRASVDSIAPEPLPPAALVERARAIAARHAPELAAAYEASDYASRTMPDAAALGGSERLLDAVRSGRLAPIEFWYRARATPLAPERNELPFPGDVQAHDPPLERPGELRIRFDPRGRLVELRRVPPEEPAAAGPAPDWSDLFAAAGLELERYELAGADGTSAGTVWRRHANDEGELLPERIEAASAGGRPLRFEPVWPWRPTSTADRPSVATVVLLSTLLAAGVGTALLARRSLRLGRADRTGARVLFLYALAMTVFYLPPLDSLATPAGARALFLALSWGTFLALVAVGSYLALEPAVRRRWPTAAISWARLLGGRPRDPMVGRDVLLGLLLGVLISIVSALGSLALDRLAGAAIPTGYRFYEALTRNVPWGEAVFAPVYGLVRLSIFLVPLVVARGLLRRDGPALAATTLLFALTALPGASSAGAAALAFAAASFSVLVLLLIATRLGVLAALASQVGAHFLDHPVSLDLDAWTTRNSLPNLLVLVGLALAGFVVAIGHRRALPALPFED
jgi:serine/threonine-protein kinase